jgi:chorismate mutase / prephenate dehydratase
MDIKDLRRQIDATDAEIVRLLAQRLRIASEIGQQKEKQGKPVADKVREEVVRRNVKKLAAEYKLCTEDVDRIYQQIIGTCRQSQGVSVAFQGEIGAYGEEAAINFFGPAIEVKACESFDEVFRMVEQAGAQFGIVPVENSLEGSINRVYDLLLSSTLQVQGETELRVSHCLIGHPGANLDNIKKIYSHPQALAQSQSFLKHLGAEIIPAYDTAGSVKMIKEKALKDSAAVASARAAEIYGMEIIAREIEDNPNNFTRFFALAHEDSPPTGKDKTSIVFSVKHRPGSLYDALREFADRKINLLKIESRPTRQKVWEYNFYLDFEGHRQDTIAQEALKSLEDHSLFIKVLGSYPRSK